MVPHIVVFVADSAEAEDAETLRILRCIVAFFPVGRNPSFSLDTNLTLNPIHPVH